MNGNWYWYAVRYNRLRGKTPHFLIAKASFYGGGSITNMRVACWASSADTNDWHDFDNVTVGVTDVEFYNNTPFPTGMIYIALMPMYPFSRTARKVEEWSEHPYVSETASTVGKIFGNMTPRTTVDGRIAPALPYYAFKISKNSGNSKNKAIFASRQHPSESSGAFALEGAVDWLLAGSIEAEEILDWFDIYVYPCTNPQGVWSGYNRSTPQTPGTQHNEWVTPGLFECVDAHKVAMLADTGGSIDAGIDFHAYASSLQVMGDVTNSTSPIQIAFRDKYKVFDTNFYLLQEAPGIMLSEIWETDYNATFSLVLEQGGNKTRTLSDFMTSGVYAMKSFRGLLREGWFTYAPALPGSRVLNGTTDWMYWPSIFTVGASQPMSISLWMYLDRNNVYQIPIQFTASDNSSGVYISQPGSVNVGGIGFVAHGTGSTHMYRTSVANILPNSTWLHVVATWDGVQTSYSGAHIYVNGTEVTYQYNANGASPKVFSGPWAVGGSYLGDTNRLDGRIAHTAVWDRIITPSEIAGLAALNSPQFYPSGLRFYVPMASVSCKDTITQNDAVLDGTTFLADGPNIIYPT
jgi:hypothetical protein